MSVEALPGNVPTSPELMPSNTGWLSGLELVAHEERVSLTPLPARPPVAFLGSGPPAGPGSPVPIDVIFADNLARSGFTETNRLLNEQLPSFNFPQPSITDGTDVVRPATLRAAIR